MPFYRYECEKCGHEFRVLHARDADEDVSCPSCKSTDVRRLLSRVSVQFKGSGYYKTDRANKKSKVGTKGLNGKDSSSGASAGETKDAKPDKSDRSDRSDKPDKPSKSD